MRVNIALVCTLVLSLSATVGCGNDEEVEALRKEVEALKAAKDHDDDRDKDDDDDRSSKKKSKKSKVDTKEVTAKGVSFTLAYAPAGTFTMGSPEDEEGHRDNETQHTVTLTQGFHIGTTEVTQELYEAVMGDNPSSHSSCATCPVVSVDWYDAVKFCNALSKLEGLKPAYSISGDNVTRNQGASGYRLPTEAEWEYAARAGETHPYAGSDDVDAVAWYSGNSSGKTHPVATKAPNAWGLYDMSGNVFEWTGDWYDYYDTSRDKDPQGPSTGDARVYRGGGLRNLADLSRAAFRNCLNPDLADRNLGFRVVLPE